MKASGRRETLLDKQINHNTTWLNAVTAEARMGAQGGQRLQRPAVPGEAGGGFIVLMQLTLEDVRGPWRNNLQREQIFFQTLISVRKTYLTAA